MWSKEDVGHLHTCTTVMSVSFLHNYRPKGHPVSEAVSIVGDILVKPLPAGVAEKANLTSRMVQVFYRAEYKHHIYYSKDYGRVKARNSYTVTYCSQGQIQYGFILYFFVACETAFAVIDKLDTCYHNPHPCRSAPISVQRNGEIDVIDITSLQEKIMYIHNSKYAIVVTFPQSATWLIPD